MVSSLLVVMLAIFSPISCHSINLAPGRCPVSHSMGVLTSIIKAELLLSATIIVVGISKMNVKKNDFIVVTIPCLDLSMILYPF